MTLADVNREYESIMRADISPYDRSYRLAKLMTLMEREFRIPALQDAAWEAQNRAVIAMYRKISMSREI